LVKTLDKEKKTTSGNLRKRGGSSCKLRRKNGVTREKGNKSNQLLGKGGKKKTPKLTGSGLGGVHQLKVY